MTSKVRYPSAEQVDRLYRRIVTLTGGEYGYLNRSNLQYILDTVKDLGSKLPRKQSLIRKAAFLLHKIIALHPLVNGNKRTGYEAAKLFLELNGYKFTPEIEETYGFLLQIAEGKASAKDVERWIARNLTEMRKI